MKWYLIDLDMEEFMTGSELLMRSEKVCNEVVEHLHLVTDELIFWFCIEFN